MLIGRRVVNGAKSVISPNLFSYFHRRTFLHTRQRDATQHTFIIIPSLVKLYNTMTTRARKNVQIPDF